MEDNLTLQIQELLNKHCREARSDTPDFILAQYIMSCLEAYEIAVKDTKHWLNKGGKII